LPHGIGDQSGGVNLEVTHGSFVVVAGPAGSGKSTLLRALVGVESLASGDVSITDSHALFAEHVGVSLSAREANASDEWIDRLGLTEFADRPMRTLSGGQRQKALLAIALSSDAEVLLLDDPTSALDEENRELVTQNLRDETDRTLVVASNDELVVSSADATITLI
jgi:ABC-type cobalamin/Fe3+-siderophores transport system ATPase subunit